VESGLARRSSWFDPLLGFVIVVSPAPQLDVLDRGRPVRKRNPMVELEEAAFLTTAIGSREPALRAVAQPHFAPDK
jgi:hypothetical protein